MYYTDSTFEKQLNSEPVERKFQFDLTIDALSRIDSEIQKVNEFEAVIAKATEALKGMKEHLKQSVYNEITALQRDNPEASIELATELYWFREDDIKTMPICEALGVAPQTIDRALPPALVPLVCATCGNPYDTEVTTRSQLKRVREYAHRSQCDDCEVKSKQQNHERYEQFRLEQQRVIDSLRAMPYSEYLQTDHWKTLRTKMLKRAHFSCQLCNKSNVSLHVHHRTYINRGNEDFSDLIVLCAGCHSRFHDKMELMK